MNRDPALDLIEEGAASVQLAGASDHYDVIVIGGGQAGLAVGYHLKQAGMHFTILDANERTGDSWRKRWDSLRLFSSARLDGLVGMRFPAAGDYFPTKDEMADYLEAYAVRFRLPVRHGVRVQRLFKRGERFVVQAGKLELEADHVVVAMAGYQHAKQPAFADQLNPGIFQMHSSDYRNLAQLRPGGVLLVGAGNSGAEIAMELARGGHDVWLAGPKTGEVPFRPGTFIGRNFLQPLLVRLVFHRILTIRWPLGRKARAAILRKGSAPLIRVKSRDLAAAGVERVARVTGARAGRPLLADGRTLDVANVIWCSGFDPGFQWIELPVLGPDGKPVQTGGVVENQPGLYFVGLTFLYAMSSSMVHGVSRDAGRIVKMITGRLPARSVAGQARGGATRAQSLEA